jgi:hypothetical protein
MVPAFALSFAIIVLVAVSIRVRTASRAAFVALLALAVPLLTSVSRATESPLPRTLSESLRTGAKEAFQISAARLPNAVIVRELYPHMSPAIPVADVRVRPAADQTAVAMELVDAPPPGASAIRKVLSIDMRSPRSAVPHVIVAGHVPTVVDAVKESDCQPVAMAVMVAVSISAVPEGENTDSQHGVVVGTY